MRAIIDLESRSKANLSIVGAINYAQHKSTSIFCVGYKIDDKPSKLWIPEREKMPSKLWMAFQRGELVSHNAGFERAMIKHCLIRYSCLTDAQKICLKELTPSRWRCSAAKAAASSLPRGLEGACAALSLPIQKDMEGHRLMVKYSKPRKPSKNNPALWWSDEEDIRRIYKYCLVDVDAEYLLDEALPDLSDYEQRVWELDQKINDRGILIDIPTVKTILGMIHEETARITRNVQKLSRGDVTKVTQTARVLAWVNARGADMPNMKASTIRDKLLESDLNPRVRRMLEYRQGGSKSSTAKYVSMLLAVGSDHRARELLLYNGAVPTARWSGKRIQPQNFPRGHLKWIDMERIIDRIKSDAKRYGK